MQLQTDPQTYIIIQHDNNYNHSTNTFTDNKLLILINTDLQVDWLCYYSYNFINFASPDWAEITIVE